MTIEGLCADQPINPTEFEVMKETKLFTGLDLKTKRVCLYISLIKISLFTAMRIK